MCWADWVSAKVRTIGRDSLSVRIRECGISPLLCCIGLDLIS